MYIYLMVFALSTLMIYASERTRGKRLRSFLIIVSIFLPSLLAGLRADSIGTDTTIYGISFYERAVSSSNIFDYFSKQILYSANDMGFNTVTYICSLISKDYHFGLFVYQFITLTFIYMGAYRFKKLFGSPVTVVILLYYLCLYNYTLNAMRQSIAAAVIFYAASFLFESRYKKFVLLVLIAMTLHSSAIIGFAILPVYLLTKQGQVINEQKQLFRCSVLIIGIAAIVLLSTRLVTLLVNIGLFRGNYLNYLSGGKYSNSGDGSNLSMFVLAFQMAYMVILIINHRRLEHQNREPLFFTMVSAIVLLATCFGPVVADYISRLSYYFIPMQMVGLTNTSFCFSTRKHSRTVWLLGIFLLVFLYWLRSVVIFNYAFTVPYSFYWD